MAFNILIVDDSEVTRKVMERTCMLSGVDLGVIHHAANGKEALDVLSEHWIDIVFADINMPIMNGCELIAEISKRAEWERVPVVVVSTDGSKARLEELRQLGIRDFIRKPFTPEQVATVIHQILGPAHV